MTKEEYISQLEENSLLPESKLRDYHLLLEQFPYFQSARAIQLKALKQHHSFNYNPALKKTAAYTTNREVLFDYITSEAFDQQEVSEKIKYRIQLEDQREENLEMNLTEANRVLDPELFQKISSVKEEKLEEDVLEQGKPLAFTPKEKHSFSQWLQLTSAKPVNEKETSSSASDDRFRLIDKFIEKKPKIVPSKEAPSRAAQISSEPADTSLMTETLARVYLEQKNYSKAIQAFKILILKNPEKSGLFADKIRAIEKLQENKSS
ncbi:hypothetical protein RBU60_05620 [Mesonia sp. MT50]|uniref:Tetratricopeptide repeat protein n=1 Tax=Mesonia profundi TaxID=3070998 RepID=A0ABU1A025_9FLAO|nr:hypothetical protein [Mesonia profundi]MDQ7917048.1 hypothetical protein [Mesonia profundi]